MSRTRVYEWHKSFKSGREGTHPDPGRPTTSINDENIQNVYELVHSDRRMSVRMLAEELRLGRDSLRIILTEDLGMKIPKLLSNDQKACSVDLLRDVLEHLEGNPEFLDDVTVEPPMKDGGVSQTKENRMSKSKMKVRCSLPSLTTKDWFITRGDCESTLLQRSAQPPDCTDPTLKA